MKRDHINSVSSDRDIEYSHHLRSLAAALNLEAERARGRQFYALEDALNDAAAAARFYAGDRR